MKTNAPTATSSLPEFLTPEQLQELLQIGRSLAYQLARQHGVRVGNGKLLRIPRKRIAEMTAA